MKTLLTIITLLLSINLFSQNLVDIKITDVTPTFIEITLYPAYDQVSVLSNVVFTLKWKSNQNMALGEPLSNDIIYIYKSGQVITNDKNKYQIFAGFGMTTIDIKEPFAIRIPKTGNAKITISNDAFVRNIFVNGEFYVSIGGENVTGKILEPVPGSSDTNSTVRLFYDQNTDQTLIEKDGIYTNTLGQRVIVVNPSRLLFLEKR